VKPKKRTKFKRGQLKSKLEAKVQDQLVGVDFTYEPYYLHFTKPRKYLPDFAVVPRTRNLFLLEVKGYFTSADRSKTLAVKKQHPNIDLRFVFDKDNRLSKKSKTKYSDWCKQHGFLYSLNGIVPKNWLT
jgi:Phage endonuclease I